MASKLAGIMQRLRFWLTAWCFLPYDLALHADRAEERLTNSTWCLRDAIDSMRFELLTESRIQDARHESTMHTLRALQQAVETAVRSHAEELSHFRGRLTDWVAHLPPTREDAAGLLASPEISCADCGTRTHRFAHYPDRTLCLECHEARCSHG